MDPDDRSPQARDARLRLVGRLRVGLVSVGIAGSLGVAGVAAVSSQDASADPSPSSLTRSGPGDVSRGETDRDEQPAGADDAHQSTPPTLQQGYGSAHGSTSGS
jgi:hypothetical protein